MPKNKQKIPPINQSRRWRGRGMRIVERFDQLNEQVAASEAELWFGDDSVDVIYKTLATLKCGDGNDNAIHV